MDRKHKNYSFLSKRHFRRIIANNTASDLLNLSNNEHLELRDELLQSDTSEDLELLENEFVNRNDELVDNLNESDTVDDNESNNEEGEMHRNDSNNSSESDTNGNELTESVVHYINVEPGNKTDNQDDQFIKDIASWAIMFNIFQVAIRALLIILRKYTRHSFPKDPRTLLSPRHTAIIEMGVGLYCHFDLQNAFKKMLDEYNTVLGRIPASLDIFINIDGLPISKSSNATLWPILCSDTVLKSVFIVGAYYGQRKPQCNNDFLTQFVDEAILLINTGLFYNEIQVQINFHGLICDAPAKAFILSIKYHTGYNTCSRCTITGEFLDGRLCFPATKIIDALRTDEDFANNKYDGFQIGETILKQIPNFGLVSSVVIDYMHLICLGIMKKLILLWIKGPRTVKLSQQLLNQISGALLNLQSCVLNDFVRRPQSLKDVKLWKATEFRQFLLYTGPVVLQDILRKDVYINFITLHIAVTILASPNLSKDNNNITWAQMLIEYFLKCFKKIYGVKFMSHNFHILLHICSDVRKYGPIDEFSAFRFENYMSNIKKMIRRNEKPLQQLSRRYSELNNFNMLSKKQKNSKEIFFEKIHSNGPLIDCYNFAFQYKILRTKTYTIHSNSTSNNCISFENGTVISVLNLVKCNDNTKFIIGRKLKVVKNLYSEPIYPCASEELGIQVMREDTAVCLSPCENVRNKMWKMPYDHNQFVVFPVIHT
ncbi:uncharacterized protein LOC113002646 isoform X1 [Solenopsis invicta]|uniref:uncharacterized protein LOC113002646 isoform X1 n=1 Tax=Solenopsis invicta TaxID=13686 RepID=UPI00193E63F7|nr:uncharacterized protein LOC113002646 isoform X1 [Solenopsis invicta]